MSVRTLLDLQRRSAGHKGLSRAGHVSKVQVSAKLLFGRGTVHGGRGQCGRKRVQMKVDVVA